ncbi:MAG: glycoside hydrolase family 3 N-terminal domain-containing protein [Candidatus Saccharibacteria bacterium]
MRKRRVLLGLCGVVVIGVAVGIGLHMGGYRHSGGSVPHGGGGTASHTPEDKLACVQALPQDIQIGQKLMLAGYSDQLPGSTAALSQASIGGVIIMDQTPAAEIATFRGAFKIAPTIGVDQEGGPVQRYTSEGLLPGAEAMASGFSAAQAYQQYLSDDRFLKGMGITTNFAPVLDVISYMPEPLPGRMYSSDPAVVAQYASAAIRAAQTADITPVVKHFPGLGSTAIDTDYGTATSDPLATLRTRDLLPYQQVSPLKPDAMVGNVIVPDLTDGQPAVWSAAAVKLLRSYGYQDSVVYTDSLTADAIPGTLEDAVVKAWQAGIDVALVVQTHDHTADVPSYIQSITASADAALQSGRLDSKAFAASVLRILDRKGIDPCTLAY